MGSGGNRPERILSPDGLILTLLAGEVAAPVLRVVVAFARLRTGNAIDALSRIAAERSWPAIEAFSNVALARPAWQSSVGMWSRHRNYRLDAEGGNDGDHAVDHAFHTDDEPQPYWTVGLQHRSLPTEIRIYNRPHHAGRLTSFRLLASLDGETWHAAHESSPRIDLGANAEEPIKIALFTPAQLLRVQLPHGGVLHFRGVRGLRTPFASP